ncbi:amino acid permease [Legionella sp. D16C41]|uniref:amino acid permease n=1 Tax=Legionella sp. D16C41 TaxID=3402688 RepID=UPI003AF48954
MNLKFIGGILLIVGTSIGGGMLALPVATAAAGFWSSSIFLLLCWAVMTLGALFILEANLYLPPGKHMVSMAAATLGNKGLLIAWLSYLFLLYTLLSAYISGGADVMGSLFLRMGIPLKEWQSSFLFTLLFGLVVYSGIHKVDLLNRALMFGKLAVYSILIILIAPHVHILNLGHGNYHYITASIMILITSFGFAIIVPNLRDYFNDDLVTLRKVIFIGSLIPLLCYLAWNAVIIGSLPSQGEKGLAALMQSEHTTSDLANVLSNTVQNTVISTFFNFFTSICMLTAFLGVSLCLISFLADGFKMEQKGRNGFLLFCLTFLPPLIIVIYYPGAYIHALNYAGIICVILLLLLPALMVAYGRKKFVSRYLAPGGLYMPWVIVVISILLLANAIIQLF